MSDSANGLDLPRTGEPWEARPGTGWAPADAGPIPEAPTGDARHAGQREDDVPSSFFHLRWLGDAD